MVTPEQQAGPDQQAQVEQFAVPGATGPQLYDSLKGHDRAAEAALAGHQVP